MASLLVFPYLPVMYDSILNRNPSRQSLLVQAVPQELWRHINEVDKSKQA